MSGETGKTETGKTETGKKRSHFGGYVRELFRDAATVEIWNGPDVRKGEMVTVLKKDFAEQSFLTGVGPGDYVEGVVLTDPVNPAAPREFKYVTKII